MDEDWGRLTISKDCMISTVALKRPPQGESIKVDEEMIRTLAAKAGIKVALIQESIDYLVRSAGYDEEVIIARGKGATRGNDGFFSFSVPMEDMRAKPVINSDGSADYMNSLKLALVSEGEVFAKYNKATFGESGHDIYMNDVVAMSGKDLPKLRGHGIIYDETTSEYRAEYSGHIVKNGDSIKIEKLFTVNGDLDLETGNIKFNGDVEVSGDMRSGLEIEADGNVFIHGHVGACIIKSGKNITISKGVQGRDKCFISAKGDVACKFVERCNITADGNVYADSVLNSTIIAKNQIIVNSKSGMVVSSNIRGMLGVTVKEAGNDSEILTILQSGVPREDVIASSEYQKQLISLDIKRRQLEAHQRIIDAGDRPDKNELRTKIMRAKVIVASEEKKIHDILDPLLELIDKSKRESSITVTGIAHAGIKIHINGIHYQVKESVMDVHFRVAGSEILMEAGEQG